MKKKKSSLNVYDIKKYLMVATVDYDNFTLIFIIFLLLLWYFAIFIRHPK